MSDMTVKLGSPNFTTGTIPVTYTYDTKKVTRSVNMVFTPPTQRDQTSYDATQTTARAQELVPSMIVKIQTGAVAIDK